jgi:hypothetical protein
VWCVDSIVDVGTARTDVFDLSCPHAQRLLSTDKEKSRRSSQMNADDKKKKIRVHLREPAAYFRF